MSSKTTNLNLTKPSEDEFYDINVQNENMDIIDKEIGELKNPIFASSDVADGEATEWTSVEVLTSKEKHTSVLVKISQMFKNIRFLNNKYKELNQSLTWTERNISFTYNGITCIIISNGNRINNLSIFSQNTPIELGTSKQFATVGSLGYTISADVVKRIKVTNTISGTLKITTDGLVQFGLTVDINGNPINLVRGSDVYINEVLLF